MYLECTLFLGPLASFTEKLVGNANSTIRAHFG